MDMMRTIERKGCKWDETCGYRFRLLDFVNGKDFMHMLQNRATQPDLLSTGEQNSAGQCRLHGLVVWILLTTVSARLSTTTGIRSIGGGRWWRAVMGMVLMRRRRVLLLVDQGERLVEGCLKV